jgi:hypothetical protein
MFTIISKARSSRIDVGILYEVILWVCLLQLQTWPYESSIKSPLQQRKQESCQGYSFVQSGKKLKSKESRTNIQEIRFSNVTVLEIKLDLF